MAKIIFKPHPLKATRLIKEYKRSFKLKTILKKLNAKGNYHVVINGISPKMVSKDLIIKKEDRLSIISVVEGGLDNEQGKVLTTIVQIAAIALIATGAGAGLGAALGASASAAAAVGNAVILVASSLLVLGIRSAIGQQRSLAASSGVEQAQSPTYSLSAAGNSARAYQPMPLVLGNHQIFPDFDSNPYSDFVYGLVGSYTEQTTTSNVSIDITSPAYSNLWSLVSAGQLFDGTNYINLFNSLGLWEVMGNKNSTTTVDYTDTNYIKIIAGTSQVLRPRKPFDVSDGKSVLQKNNIIIRWSFSGTRYFSYSVFYFWYTTLYNPLSSQVANANSLISFLDTNTASYTEVIPGDFNDTNPNLLHQLTRITNYPMLQETFYLEHREPPTQKIVHIFNFGFGDIDYEDLKFTESDLTTYRGFDNSINVYTATSWPVLTYFSGNTLADAGAHPVVATRQGNQVINNDVLPPDNNSWSFPNNYHYKKSPKNTTRIKLFVEGRLFRTSAATGGAVANSVTLTFEYREVGSASWLPLVQGSQYPTSGSSIIFSHASYDPFRAVVSKNVAVGEYEIRYAKVNEDSIDANVVDDISVTEAQFWVSDSTPHVAQNRMVVHVTASAQISGALGRFSAYIKNRCWVWDGSTWNYTFTENPAWWFLYVSRGGFENQVDENMSARPGWLNGYSVNNKRRLFGGGLRDEQIDIEKLKLWALFCDVNNLKFSAVIDQAQNTAEVLTNIASVGRAAITWETGKIGVIFEDPSQPAIALFGPHNIKAGTFSVTYINENLPEEIVCTFMNPDLNWTIDQVSAIRPDFTGNPTNRVTIDLFGVKYKSQAQREANLIAAKQAYQRRQISFTLDAEGLIVSRGDVVLLSHDLTQWGITGRAIKFNISGNVCTSIEFDCDMLGSTYLVLRDLNNNLTYNQGTSNEGLFIFNNPISAISCPFYINDNHDTNSLSSYPESFPHDWMGLADYQSTPGKRIRIVGIQPSGENTFKISATDEDLAMYSHEFQDVTPEPYNPGSYTLVKVRAFNPYIVENKNLLQIIEWESDGAIAFTIQASVNGSSFSPLLKSGSITHYDSRLELNYATGSIVLLKISPFFVGSPQFVEPTEISFVVL